MSQQPHIIRLRDPWTWIESVPGDGEPIDGVQLIGERAFHRPTGLGPATGVQLVIASSLAPAHVCLNGQPVTSATGTDQPWRAEISQLLKPRNHLRLEFVPPSPATLATIKDELTAGCVRLEICE